MDGRANTSDDIEMESEQRECLNKPKDEKHKEAGHESPKKFWDEITLEPMWCGVTISLTMGIIAYKNLFLQRACLVDLGYSEDACFRSKGEDKYSIEFETQKIISHLSIASGFIGGIITSIIMMFLGPWSDSSGRRKPLMILPVIGTLVTTVSLLVVQAFPKVSTIWVVYLEVIPLAVGGNFSLLMMAGFSYLGDICYKTGRCATIVMGWNMATLFSCMVVGSLTGPIIYRTLGFVGLFSISLCLEFTSLVYIIWWVKDVNITEKVPSVLDFTLPWKALQCVFKKRDGNRRKIIWLMIIVPCSNSLIMMSEISITYLYLRNTLHWAEMEYGILLAVRSIIQVLGTIVIVRVLKQKLNLRDETIGVIGAASSLFTSIAFMFSYNNWMIFGFTFLGLLKGGAFIAERPVLNKQITALEQGKVNCVTALLEKCTSFIVIPLANYIYNLTLTNLPSSFMILSIVAAIIQIVCYSCVNKDPVEEKDEEANATTVS